MAWGTNKKVIPWQEDKIQKAAISNPTAGKAFLLAKSQCLGNHVAQDVDTVSCKTYQVCRVCMRQEDQGLKEFYFLTVKLPELAIKTVAQAYNSHLELSGKALKR